MLTYFVEIERELSRYATVEPGFQISSPVLAEYVLAASVLFAYSGDSRVHRFATVHELHCGFPKKEQDVFSDVEWPHEIGFWNRLET